MCQRKEKDKEGKGIKMGGKGREGSGGEERKGEERRGEEESDGGSVTSHLNQKQTH